MKTIDCRGLACPAPVLQTKETLEREHPNSIRVLVDNEAARQNVSRFLTSRNFHVYDETDGVDFFVTGETSHEGGAGHDDTLAVFREESQKIMVMVSTDCMGHGDDELGALLMGNFIGTLREMGEELWRLVFVNNGVKLTIDGSPVLPVLREYEEEGLDILVCGTCLNHFQLLDIKRVGETTNMLDIITSMQLADKVINI